MTDEKTTEELALELEMEQLIVKLFGWIGVLDQKFSDDIKRVIDSGAPERLRTRLYELFRNRLGNLMIEKIVRYGVEGTLRNLSKGEGGTITSMSDLA